MQIKKYASLNRGLSWNFLVFEKYKPCEIYRRKWDVYREACFSQRILKNGLNIDLPLWKLEWNRQSMVWKHTDSQVKKMFLAQESVKKVILIILFKDMKELITSDFFEKV